MAEAADWMELEKFSNNKISAKFGGEQFIDVCLQHNNKFEGKKYLPKVSKVRFWSACCKRLTSASSGKNISIMPYFVNDFVILSSPSSIFSSQTRSNIV